LVELLQNDGATLEELNTILNEYQQSCELIISNITRASNLIQKFKAIAAEQGNEVHEQMLLPQVLQEFADAVALSFKQLQVDVEIQVEADLWLTSSHSLLKQANSMPIARPTNSVGVKTPPGAPEPLLASTASSLQINTPTSSAPDGGSSK